MARLWSASPTISTPSAMAATRPVVTRSRPASGRGCGSPRAPGTDRAAPAGRAGGSPSQSPCPSGRTTRCAYRSGSQWTSGSRVCTSIGKQPVRRRDEHAPADAERLGDEEPLPLGVTDVLDHRVREDDVEGVVVERQRARVTLDVRDLRIPTAKAAAVVEAERGHLRPPRVVLLEEVVRVAPELTAVSPKLTSSTPTSSTVVVRPRSQLVAEQPQLSPPRAGEIPSAIVTWRR